MPASEGACKALMDWARLVNPLILQRAENLALERAEQNKRFEPSIIRADVEAAIIEDQERAITAQANRIRDLASENAEQFKLLEKMLIGVFGSMMPGSDIHDATTGTRLELARYFARKQAEITLAEMKGKHPKPAKTYKHNPHIERAS